MIYPSTQENFKNFLKNLETTNNRLDEMGKKLDKLTNHQNSLINKINKKIENLEQIPFPVNSLRNDHIKEIEFMNLSDKISIKDYKNHLENLELISSDFLKYSKSYESTNNEREEALSHKQTNNNAITDEICYPEDLTQKNILKIFKTFPSYDYLTNLIESYKKRIDSLSTTQYIFY